MIVEEFSVPDGEHADYLIAGLARVIALRGADTFLTAPLLLPEPRFFPDPVAPRAQGVATLIRRLLAYAGLKPTYVEIDVVDDAQAIELRPGHHADTRAAAAWFIGIDDGVYHFGIRETVLRDDEGLVGVLGHEVAHAYRDHHALVVSDTELEEKLTDLTTIYLGFGVFTLEARFRFKTGRWHGADQTMLYEKAIHGYLTAGELALLLGAQLLARNTPEDELARILEHLAPNQATALRDAHERLSATETPLAARLGLPSSYAWARPRALEDALVPLGEARVRLHDFPAERAYRDRRERIGFRIAGKGTMFGTFAGGALGFAIAIAANLHSGFWPLTLGATALGFVVGRVSGRTTCSGCGRGVKKAAAVCPKCSLPLVGDIATLEDRIEAADAYRAQHFAFPDVRCPACDWLPTPDDRWWCECEHEWCSFETSGRCPNCRKQWLDTECLRCGEASPHGAWYVRAPDSAG